MLHFNNDTAAKERGDSKPLTLEEETKVINEIDDLLWGIIRDEQLFQQFIYQYEKMKHYVARTQGLYATEFPDEITVPNNNVKEINGVEVPYLFKLEY